MAYEYLNTRSKDILIYGGGEAIATMEKGMVRCDVNHQRAAQGPKGIGRERLKSRNMKQLSAARAQSPWNNEIPRQIEVLTKGRQAVAGNTGVWDDVAGIHRDPCAARNRRMINRYFFPNRI